MSQQAEDAQVSSAMHGDIGLTDEYVLLRDEWDPETIHCIPKELAISALRLLALTQPPKSSNGTNGHANR